jgi:TPR repeat protein
MSTRTFSPRLLVLACALGTVCGAQPTLAFDGSSSRVEDHLPLSIFKNPKAALQAGLDGVRKGQKRAALAALQFAAESGESLARWKLGKMYAAGDGVPQDDLKAFSYFSDIVDNYDEDQADPREAPFVSSAFVALGVYNLRGIPNSRIGPNPERALEMFHYAAVNFGDAAAQYNMARMYLDGDGIARDGRQAARWLYLAAEKGHIESEAVLGQLLFNGYDNVAPQHARGLMWLMMARDGITDRAKYGWILDLYNRMMAASSESDRQVASMFVDDRMHRGQPLSPLPIPLPWATPAER